jgi:hypothetical protein
MNPTIYLLALSCLLKWAFAVQDPHLARHVGRIRELQQIAVLIAKTDADEEEAVGLAAAAFHETGAVLTDKRGDGGKSKGPFQVQGPLGRDHGATTALVVYRWSVATCGDLSLYAGCGRCGACPEIVVSLADPTVERR